MGNYCISSASIIDRDDDAVYTLVTISPWRFLRGVTIMSNWPLDRQRRWIGGAMIVAFWCAVLWFLSPGLPVLWGPSASAATKEAGRAIFEHEWAINDPLAHGDGLGPVFNARSCVACHFQGGVGGGGDVAHNIHNYSVVPTAGDATFHSGTVHSGAASATCKESFDLVRRRFPVVRGGQRTDPGSGCGYFVPDFDPVRMQSLQATALFGAGWIDRISPKAITHSLMSQAIANSAKEFQLDFSGIPAGHVRTLPDGRIGKFGWKAQFATLEEFVAAACANELGLGTPLAEQVKPFPKPDYPASATGLDNSQFRDLLAFVDTLPRPIEQQPSDAAERAAATHGKQLFMSIGCTACHTPDLGGVKGVYSDFLLHQLDSSIAAGAGYDPPSPP